MRASKYKKGFTIVELLIVIVVIGILAAITIVAYNGIQNRAKSAAAQSGASQASKKVMSFSVQNFDTFPATLAEVGVVNSGDTSYQYSVNNTVNPRTFCITATNQNVSYWTSSVSNSPTSGACAGHGAGGATVVTNYHKNPFFEGSAGPVNYANATNLTIVNVSGTRYAQGEVTSTSPSGIRLMSNVDRWSIGANKTVYAKVTVRNPNPSTRTFSLVIRYYDTSGATTGNLMGNTATATIPIATGATSVLIASGTTPANTASITLDVLRNTGGSPSVGDLIQTTGVWLSDADATAASGASPGWAWNGAANESTSTGPAL